MNDIVLNGVSKSFGEKRVLERFSHTFPGGKITVIGGASGRGKTTLLNLIAGLMKPDEGEITGVPEKIAFIFQEDRLCEEFGALGNLRLVCGRTKTKEELLSHLRELSLADEPKKKVGEFSGGMKRRVAIARAICFDADCVLLDEPFKGLDEALKKDVMDYVLRHTAGKTVLCVTHDPAEAEYLGAEVMIL